MPRRFKKIAVSLLTVLLSTCIISYIWLDREIVADLTPQLLHLYSEIQQNIFVQKKIQTVDVSYLSQQYDIYKIKKRYGFSYDVAETLYKYHQHHNIKIGSTNVLLEDNRLEPPKKTYNDSLDWESLDSSQKQTAKIICMLYISYWLIIILGKRCFD